MRILSILYLFPIYAQFSFLSNSLTSIMSFYLYALILLSSFITLLSILNFFFTVMLLYSFSLLYYAFPLSSVLLTSSPLYSFPLLDYMFPLFSLSSYLRSFHFFTTNSLYFLFFIHLRPYSFPFLRIPIFSFLTSTPIFFSSPLLCMSIHFILYSFSIYALIPFFLSSTASFSHI